jgi:hypothetical protein
VYLRAGGDKCRSSFVRTRQAEDLAPGSEKLADYG